MGRGRMLDRRRIGREKTQGPVGANALAPTGPCDALDLLGLPALSDQLCEEVPRTEHLGPCSSHAASGRWARGASHEALRDAPLRYERAFTKLSTASPTRPKARE